MSPYKTGKLPARPGAVRFKLTDYMALPVPPKSYGHYHLVTDPWLMLANDSVGDCVLAGAGHETMLWNREAGRTVTFTDSDVLSDYSAITDYNPNDPNSDQGTDMTVAASYRRKTGVLGHGLRHKVLAYLALETANVNQLKQAVYLFGAVGVGIQFPASAMDQFNEGKSWTATNSQIEGGHYIPVVGYDSKYFYLVTWGKLIKMTYGFYRKYNDESIAYLSQEALINNKSLEGFNLPALQGDLNAL